MEDILQALAPHVILVGSAATSSRYNDLDFVISARGLEIARKLLPGPLSSEFPGNLSTDTTEVPIEVFRYWYGPGYNSLSRRTTELITRTLYGVTFRAWPHGTKD